MESERRSDAALRQEMRTLFASDYAKSRENFAAAVRAAGLNIDTRVHPLRGPMGERLSCDVVWAGPRAARRVLVLISGSHGVEGFAGSAVEIDWLRSDGAARLPDNCGVLLIHAVNPWGFAWLRRVTEDGVDLNRNFVDFTALPPDQGYMALADAIVPSDIEDLSEADAVLASFVAAQGEEVLNLALSSGQYTHPTGLYYGGSAPSWSRTLLETLSTDYDLDERAALCVIDLHTGLGPYGYGELICDHLPGSPSVALAKAWFGESVTEPALGTASSVPNRGQADMHWHRLVGDRGCMLTLEFGTFSKDETFQALRADHWLHARGKVDWNAEETRVIKRRLRHAFYPEKADWQEMILFRGRQVIAQAFEGLRTFMS